MISKLTNQLIEILFKKISNSKNRLNYIIPTIIVFMVLFYSCSEIDNREPLIDDLTIPGQVSNVQIEPLPGAIKLTYDMPVEQNFSYVKAECLINGVIRQAKASSYVNSLILEGFADTSLYTVNLYSVSSSEMMSNPVAVEARPLSPSFQEVFKNLRLTDDWGGITAFFENPNEADLSITMLYKDSTGFWIQGETFFTKKIEGSVSMRGLEPQKNEFGVFVRDRWENSSDTLIKELTPRYEKQLDRLQFKEMNLPGEPAYYSTGNTPRVMWDGLLNGDPALLTLFGEWPQWVTIDLGVTEGVLLSRFKYWQRGNTRYENYAYDDRNIKKFEIWGSMDPNPDGSWDSWTLLLDDEVVKPSGLPRGQVSDEDMEEWYGGHEFSFPIENPYVRYIRIKVTETWGGIERFMGSEIMIWGQEPSDIQN